MLEFKTKIVDKKNNEPVTWKMTVNNGYDKWYLILGRSEVFDLFEASRKMFNEYNRGVGY